MSKQCIDPLVGKILAGWRYDISGIAPEMRGDYEQHFAECERCRSRRRLHRGIDLSLITLASVSAGLFLIAFVVIRHYGPRHAFWLEVGALGGFALSALIWLIVAVATPAPLAVVDVARLGARRVHDRLPQEIRDRLPEEIRLRITGS
jgi:Flp pilus assembly protein TadB